MSTTREVAESIARRGLPFSAFRNEVEWEVTLVFMTNEISSALRAERERAVKIAETKAAEYRAESDKAEGIHNERPNVWTIRARTASVIATAIREGTPLE